MTEHKEALSYLLGEMKTNMQALADEAEMEQALHDSNTDIEKAVSTSFAKKVAAKLTTVERLLYLYSDAHRFDRRETLHYITAHRRDNTGIIEIQTAPNRVVIRMPYLPKRNTTRSIVTDALAAKLFNERDLPKWEACVVTFCHVFPGSTRRIPKDADNYEYKRTIDLICHAFGISDCPLTFEYTMRTVFTDQLDPGTYIEIQPKSLDSAILPGWDVSSAV